MTAQSARTACRRLRSNLLLILLLAALLGACIRLDLEPLTETVLNGFAELENLFIETEQALTEQLGEDFAAELARTPAHVDFVFVEHRRRRTTHFRLYTRHEFDPQDPPQWVQRLVHSPELTRIEAPADVDWWLSDEEARCAEFYLIPTADPEMATAQAALLEDGSAYVAIHCRKTEDHPSASRHFINSIHLSGSIAPAPKPEMQRVRELRLVP